MFCFQKFIRCRLRMFHLILSNNHGKPGAGNFCCFQECKNKSMIAIRNQSKTPMVAKVVEDLSCAWNDNYFFRSLCSHKKVMITKKSINKCFGCFGKKLFHNNSAAFAEITQDMSIRNFLLNMIFFECCLISYKMTAIALNQSIIQIKADQASSH